LGVPQSDAVATERSITKMIGLFCFIYL
jgi:hypothetical protein